MPFIHKETFRQDYSDEPELKLPSHWVVQYYDTDSDDGFPLAAYFSTQAEAIEFEKQLDEV